jgi:hypothetical protein
MNETACLRAAYCIAICFAGKRCLARRLCANILFPAQRRFVPTLFAGASLVVVDAVISLSSQGILLRRRITKSTREYFNEKIYCRMDRAPNNREVTDSEKSESLIGAVAPPRQNGPIRRTRRMRP